MKKPSAGKGKTYAQPSQDVFDFMLPKAEWKPVSPSDWPDFRKGADFIGVDTETHDPNLTESGPGFIRGDAKVVGISLANDVGESIYLPIAHGAGGNYDPIQVKRYVNDMLSGQTQKVFANALYDIEALWHTGVSVSSQWCDIQTAAPLIDEERSDGYSLNSLAKEYLGEGKAEAALREAASAYGIDPKGGLHHLHPKFVAEYAEADAMMPIEIWQKQQKQIKAEKLEGVLELEMRLQPVLWEMRRRGHRMDMDRLDSLDHMYTQVLKENYELMYAITKRDVKYTSGAQLGAMMEKLGYRDIPTTKSGLSMTNDWLKERMAEDELCRVLFKMRDYNKMHNDFIIKLKTMAIGDRVHPSWVAMASEEGGTKTGRMACRDPGLQQIPARSEHVRIREAFIAEEGQKFVSLDYRAVEPRLAVEFASRIRVNKDGYWDKDGLPLPGAAEMLQTYIDDPSTDFHNAVQAMIKAETGELLPRKDVKDIGLGVLYSLGEQNMAIKMGISRDQCKRVREAYFKGAPFIKGLLKVVEDLASTQGYTRTLAGRRKRFERWEPANYEEKRRWGWNFTWASYEEALDQCGSVQRAFIYRAPNAKIQGSSADITKSAIVELYYDHGIVPLSAVHDELNFSLTEDMVPTVRYSMETVAKRKFGVTMPLATATAIEDNWGACK